MANPIEKVAILFMENHTTDNFMSEVAGVDGDPALPLAPDVVSSPRLGGLRDGARARVAGMIVCRQRSGPSSACSRSLCP